ncbi:MAG: hypothetical protein ABEJ65_04305, partial [bacterium]
VPDVVLVSSSSSYDWEQDVDYRVREDIQEHSGDVDVYLFSYESAEILEDYLNKHADEELLEPVSMYGYSEIRNMCLIACHILGYETIVSTDDDVVYDDPEYSQKAREYIKTEVPETGEVANVVCGPYYTEEGSINYAGAPPPWMAYWNNAGAMNRAFDQYIFDEPRLKETSYVVMGNIVLHKDYYTEVPLDPHCHRGEDMDWLINARMFGHRFYMDSELCVQHKPPPRGFPLWKLVRLDIERFIYDRRKVRQLEAEMGIPTDYFEPWPGEFLDEQLEERIYKTNMMLSNQFLADGEDEHAEGCLDNIFYARHQYDPGDPLPNMKSFQDKWKRLMGFIDEHRGELCEAIFDRSPVT